MTASTRTTGSPRHGTPRAGLVALVAAMLAVGVGPALGSSSGAVTARQVATTVHATLGRKLSRECSSHGASCVSGPFRQVIVSFVSRVPVPSGDHYEITLTFVPTGPCALDQGGQGGPTLHLIRAGQRVREVFDLRVCPRIINGAVAYSGSNAAPHKQRHVPGVGYIDGLLVGTFTLRMS
jgi:hypothetical protein